MSKYDFILTALIPINEIGDSLNFSNDRQYRIDKLLRVLRGELMVARTTYEFEIKYQQALEAIYRNGFEDVHRLIEDVKNQSSLDRIPLEREFRSNDTPRKTPKANIKKLQPNIINTGGQFLNVLYKVISNPITLTIIAILATFIITIVGVYIVEHEKTVKFFNQYLPFIHLK